MTINFNQDTNRANMLSLLTSTENAISSNLNCCRVAIVDEFYPENLTVKVKLVNKVTLDLQKDGTQIVEEYPPIYAKVCYCNPNITEPIAKDTNGFLIFSDREIESWFINGQVNQLAYMRRHELTDAIFVPAMYCLPIIETSRLIAECLHLFYGASSVQIKDGNIDIDTSLLNITKDVTVGQTMTSNNVIVQTGASGSFVSKDDKTVVVENGIVKSIG